MRGGAHSFIRSFVRHSRARGVGARRRVRVAMSIATLTRVVGASRARTMRSRDGPRSRAREFSTAATRASTGASASTSTMVRDDDANGTTTTRSESSIVVRYAVQRGDSLYSIARDHGIETERLVAENALGVRRSIEVGQTIRVPVNLEGASYAVRAKLTNAPLGNTPASSSRRQTSNMRLGGLAPRATTATTRRRVGRDHRVVTPARTVGVGACLAISVALLSASARGSRSKRAARRAFKGGAKTSTTTVAKPAAPAISTKPTSSTFLDDRDAMLAEVTSMREILRSYDFSAAPLNVSAAPTERLEEERDVSTSRLLSYDEGYEAMKKRYLSEMASARARETTPDIEKEFQNAEASFFSVVRESFDDGEEAHKEDQKQSSDEDEDDEGNDDGDGGQRDGAASVVVDEKTPNTKSTEESNAIVVGDAKAKAREYVLANASTVQESTPRLAMKDRLSRSTSIRAASRGSDQGFKRALPMALGSLIYDAQLVVNAIQKRILG